MQIRNYSPHTVHAYLRSVSQFSKQFHTSLDCLCPFFFFFNDTATTEIYTLLYTLSLHDALPISGGHHHRPDTRRGPSRRRVRSEEHTSELQSHSNISYAVFCLKKKKQKQI